jgi:hypothetical protein
MRGARGVVATWALVGLVALGCTNRPPAAVDGGPCSEGQTLCTGSCVDVKRENANCGACGTACASADLCAALAPAAA